jgi:hypothetical protein
LGVVDADGVDGFFIALWGKHQQIENLGERSAHGRVDSVS